MRIFEAKQFGEAIRSRREKLGYTQTEVADACGVGIMFVSQLERGKETAQLGKALRVANMLGIDVTLSDRGGAR